MDQPVSVMREAGLWLATKFAAQCRERGVEHAARNLRKQGVPLWIAVALLHCVPKARRNPKPYRELAVQATAGAWLVAKVSAQCAGTGKTVRVARNLRKQGMPAPLVSVLVGIPAAHA